MLRTFIKTIRTPSRLKRDILWNVASLGLGGVSGVLANILILAWMDFDALGVFNQVLAFHLIVSQFTVGGLQFSTLKHCAQHQDSPERIPIVLSAALVPATLFATLGCLGMFLMLDPIGDLLKSADVSRGLAWGLPGLFFFPLNKILLMALNGLRHMRAFAFFQILRYLSILIGVGGVMSVGGDAPHLALSLSLAEVLLFFCLVVYIHRTLFSARPLAMADWRLWTGRHLAFGSRSVMTGIITEAAIRVDILMIGYFLDDRWVGLYSLASTLSEGFAQLPTVVRQNLDPVVGRMFTENLRQDIPPLARQVRRTFFPIMVLVGVLLLAGFPFCIPFSKSPGDLWLSWQALIILVFGVVVASGYRPFWSLPLLGGRPEVSSLITTCAFGVNILLNALFIPLLGIHGAALATAAAYVLETVSVPLLARRLFGLSI